MKPKKQPSARPAAAPNASSRPVDPGLTASRARWFRMAAVALPLVLLGLLEAGLRLGGFGYNTDFFEVRKDAAGQRFLINNDQFTFRFFPPELARWPGTIQVAEAKPAGLKRIYIFGESAAMGDPQPSVGASRYLEILLRERFPEQPFEIINLGITAINSHVILPIAEDVAARGKGDIWLIYMGNNEMVGPFGSATIFGTRAPPLALVRMNLALQKTRVGQLANRWLRGGKGSNTMWGGMKMFLKNQTSPDDPRRETVYRNFGRNLQDVVNAGRSSGVAIVLSTVSVNLRDCPPFGSMSSRHLPAADKSRFDSLYAAALQATTNGQPAVAQQSLEQAAKLDPKFAELHFRWGQFLLRDTNASQARIHLQTACDVDALPFRADTRINSAIRQLAEKLKGPAFAFCDAEAAMSAASETGIAGDESFFEHVHFNFDGNYRLAREWAEAIARVLPEEIRGKGNPGWATQETCERWLGLTDWNRMLVYTAVVGRMGQPPLAAQFNNPERLATLEKDMAVVRERCNQPTNVTTTMTNFLAAIERFPRDAFLLENFANFLESIGDTKNALVAYTRILQLLPHDFYAALQAGRLLREAGNITEAEPLLRNASRMRPSIPDPWFELGKVLGEKKQFAEALACFERASQMRPGDGAYLVHKAMALSKLGRRTESIEAYREAVKLSPGSWEGHFELAGELAGAGDTAEAIREYQETIRLNPAHAIARINLGVVLVRQNRLEEAAQQLEAALQLDPNNAAAREYLQQVQARRNPKP